MTPAPPVLAFVGGDPTQLFVVGAPLPGASGCDPRPLIPDATMTQADPISSPDGSMLAFKASRNSGADQWIGIVNADGSGLRRITPTSLEPDNPVWSHDGARIAFIAHTPPEGHSRILVVNADGSGLYQVSPELPQEFQLPQWSANDTHIAYQDGSNSRIWVSNALGTDAVDLVCGQSPSWSPNGSLLAYLSCAGRNLSTIAADGTNFKRSRRARSTPFSGPHRGPSS